ncbi:ribosome assembly RNA-binding protein YhbY [Ahniella affigens]|uniref:Ribosome assembly RNA-binding protein YhbY n=1 Tax=Ahniella affigens TaxID=2021234 RepID=A0A2P1PU85_9GAMM|nr:ribosome assembly RNA-binding protein YhbY [Ahniella affigens]
MSLNSAQIRYLRGLAHSLKPVVMLGAQGLTDAVVAALEEALAQHELIKLKTAGEDRAERDAAVAALVERTGAELVQRIGHVAVLFKRAKEPKLDVPGLPKPAPKQAERPTARPERANARRTFARDDEAPRGRRSFARDDEAPRGRRSVARDDEAPRDRRAPSKGRVYGKPKAANFGAASKSRDGQGPKRPTKVFGRAKNLTTRRGGNRSD